MCVCIIVCAVCMYLSFDVCMRIHTQMHVHMFVGMYECILCMCALCMHEHNLFMHAQCTQTILLIVCIYVCRLLQTYLLIQALLRLHSALPNSSHESRLNTELLKNSYPDSTLALPYVRHHHRLQS